MGRPPKISGWQASMNFSNFPQNMRKFLKHVSFTLSTKIGMLQKCSSMQFLIDLKRKKYNPKIGKMVPGAQIVRVEAVLAPCSW